MNSENPSSEILLPTSARNTAVSREDVTAYRLLPTAYNLIQKSMPRGAW